MAMCRRNLNLNKYMKEIFYYGADGLKKVGFNMAVIITTIFADFDLTIRIISGSAGILLAVFTIRKIIIETRVKRLEEKIKQQELLNSQRQK
jgi:hypothetical protein